MPTQVGGGVNNTQGDLKILVHDLRKPQPESLSSEVLQQLWTGELILLTRRGGVLSSLQENFDIRWFIPSLIKYRKLFGEVIIASFFLQLFALVTPLFFQVVMDKVLVHRGFTTLDVLTFGFVVIAVFDALLECARDRYVFLPHHV